jgi:hypothetical protein
MSIEEGGYSSTDLPAFGNAPNYLFYSDLEILNSLSRWLGRIGGGWDRNVLAMPLELSPDYDTHSCRACQELVSNTVQEAYWKFESTVPEQELAKCCQFPLV